MNSSNSRLCCRRAVLLLLITARDQTRESINEFLESVKSHDLAKAEILNIINIRPTNIVKIFPIVEIVKRTLPPPPEDANGAEATKSNGEEGGEQMETS
ncbi:hypothetical protein Ahy_B01g053331 isoform A [Arachis hypogaea]|uniref:DNA-directed RNA polymerase III subunit RPC9 n=1 Tax=Arachis hypogaea TaxID=3818 RepID=A0A445ARH6_ARAHY|nr:hypothetical protein Ahy_B01g053331 isoform A [Arachis hypogaea]